MGKALLLYEFNGDSDYHIFDAKITSKYNNIISIDVYGMSKCSKINLGNKYNYTNLKLYDVEVKSTIYNSNSNIYYGKYPNTNNLEILYMEDDNDFNERGMRVIAAVIGRKVCGTCISTLYSNLNI